MAIPRLIGWLRKPLMLALMAGVIANPAQASTTAGWSGTNPYTSASGNGVTVTMTSSAGFSGAVAGTMASSAFWNDPYAVSPTASIPGAADIDITLQPITTQTVTFTFSKAVDNPVLQIDRLGGSTSAGTTNSSNWKLTASNLGTLPTLTRLAGNPQFKVSANSIFRTANVTATNTECSAASATATLDDGTNACGSVQVTGAGITSLTFTITYLNTVGIGDGVELVWSVGGSKIAIRKQSVNGTRVFSFTGTNGVTSVSLDTTTLNPRTSAFFDVPNHTQPITLTEAALTDYSLTSAACTDQSGATVVSSMSGQTLTIGAAAYRANQNITCTFTNTKIPTVDLVIAKSDGVSQVVTGSTVTYTVTVTNSGPDSITAPVVKDVPGAGITCLSTNAVTISGSGVPAGSFTIANLTGGGIALGTLANGQSATLSYSCKVN